MKPNTERRRRDWLDPITEELFAVIDVRFWQLLVIGFLLGAAVTVALLAAA